MVSRASPNSRSVALNLLIDSFFQLLEEIGRSFQDLETVTTTEYVEFSKMNQRGVSDLTDGCQ